jgi:hypothetical protein
MNIQDIASAQTNVRFVPEQGESPESDPAAKNAQPLTNERNAGKVKGTVQTNERRDTYKTAAFVDRSALYDVADIRRRGEGHVLPRYQVVRHLTLEGDRLVAKVVDIILATERKSLRIYRNEK